MSPVSPVSRGLRASCLATSLTTLRATSLATVMVLVAACGGSTSSDTTDDAGGSDTTGSDTTGLDTRGSDTPGLDTTGLDTTGLDTTGSDTTGSDTTGLDTSASDSSTTDTSSTDTKSDSGGRVPVNHRASDALCAGAPGPGSCSLGGGGGPTCSADGDCKSGTNGRCVENVGGGARICFCSYDTCTHDTDCAKGKLCVCHGSPYTAGGNTCTDGACRVDADCGAGGFCSPTRGGGCGGLTGYFCHTSADTCVDDPDCAGGGGVPKICAYSATSKHWECTAQLLCP